MKRLLHHYLFWTYERGSFHYDVMVTLILLFLFVSPRFIHFGDRPVAPVALGTREVLVREAGVRGTAQRLVYEIRVEDLHGASGDAALRSAILSVIQPIGGVVSLVSYKPVLDVHGHTVAYDATVLR